MIPKMTAKALVRLAEERARQEAHRTALERAWANKVLVIALYGGQCAGSCGTTAPESLFVVHEDELLDAGASVLCGGKDRVLAAIWKAPLYDTIIRQNAPACYAPFCWMCFKRVGRQRRRTQGIVHWKDPRAAIGQNAVARKSIRPQQVVVRVPDVVVNAANVVAKK